MHQLKIHPYLLKIMLFCCLLLLCQITTPINAEDNPALELTIDEAILLALENNSSFKIEKLKPDVRESQEIQERSIFDLKMTSNLSTSRSEDNDGDTSTGVSWDWGISKSLRTGAEVSLSLSADKRDESATNGNYSSRLGLSLTQPIFKGAGSRINLVGLNKARLSTESSAYELQAYAETLISQIESTYWDYALAQQQLEIYEDSLTLAERQLDETKAMIEVGKLAEIELVASEAEVASRRESLINARSNIDKARLRLIRLMNPPDADFWKQEIVIKDKFTIPEFKLDEIDRHMEIALRMRPDINQAKLQLDRNELDVLTTKNGLLPNMEFFITLGATGYADSFTQSISDIGDRGNEIQAGLRYSKTLGQRDLKERYKQSLISQDQSELAMENLLQLAQVDVGVAWLEVNRAFEQINATKASRKLQEEKLRAETEKYRVGLSTSLLVAQAQRDFLASQISETQVIANYKTALVDLFRQEGSLLDRYNISLLDDNS